ncbi:hypothetical protein [Deminuibacter soli]|uniref:Sigma-70 family RNA polymerase sigma factor n=1 Tax=Deminuibacter soli TaxID=2291815 RepID=A0A3E1NQ49_9BACT|nr:hypothetical protein [Deminuibacter soli]RFM30027.1 hypothetical protein DXN05_03385 [Deminuibacter soli]
MRTDDKYYTDLDRDLQQLALVDWAAFVQLVGEETITSAKICLLKTRGKSLNQIATRLNVTKNQAEYRCKKCLTYSETKE